MNKKLMWMICVSVTGQSENISGRWRGGDGVGEGGRGRGGELEVQVQEKKEVGKWEEGRGGV